MEGKRWIPIFMGMTFREMGMKEVNDEIATGSTQAILSALLAMTEVLKLTISTYKLGIRWIKK